jgi:methylmalonyl-CoA/ethylmalonyl-CoA epimerase
VPYGDSSDTTRVDYLDRAPDQTAYVVPDLQEGIDRFADLLGITEWVGWDYDENYLPNKTYGGQPSDYRSIALVPTFGPRIEMIQPLVGPSVFTTFLEDRPNGGVHHLGYFVPSLAPVRERFARLGVPEIMNGGGHGVDGDGEFCYFDTYESIGTYLEFIEPPKRRHPPQSTMRPQR